jgi:hypothetical protein
MGAHKNSRPEMEDAEELLRVLDTPLAKRLGGYILIAEDLKYAANWFYMASSAEKKECCSFALAYRDACVRAGAITYRRCFNSGERTRLKAKEARAIVEPNGAELHPQIIDMANRMIAHAASRYERAFVGARCLFHRGKNLHAFVDTCDMWMKTWGFSDDRIHEFALLCHALVDFVEPEIERMRTRLRQEVPRMPPELLFNSPVAGVLLENDGKPGKILDALTIHTPTPRVLGVGT